MSKNVITHAVELQIQFVFEKRTESYKWYDEGSIGKENWTKPHKTGFAGTPGIWSQQISKPQAWLEGWQIGAWL